MAAETTYHYAVLALSAEGDGAQSAAVSATTPAAPQQATVPDLRLSSTAAGQLTISWDTPQPTPSDYRIIWAKQDLDFPSYTAANEANRGNEYPGGTETSITLTGLAKGETFRAQMRARHTSGGDNNGAWSGPWSDTVTARVKDDLPTAPTGLTASRVTHDTRAEPEPKKEKDKPPTNRVTRAAPGAPLNLTAVSGASQLTFSWDPSASDGGSAIVRYNHKLSTGGTDVANSDANTTVTTGRHTYTKTGLTNGTQYIFHVRAITNFGGSVTVGSYATVSATPGMPKAPARPMVEPVPRTTDSLTVKWTAPENTGRPAITSYDVRHSSDFGESWTDGPQDASAVSVTLTDLVYGESFGTYLVQVRATNTAGDGPWSESARETLFPPDEEVAADLGLVPAGVRNGGRFRLLFITHDTTTAESDQGYLFDNSAGSDWDNSVKGKSRPTEFQIWAEVF